MSGLGLNKIAAGLLATALGVVGLHEVSGMVFEPHIAKKGEWPEVQLETGGAEAAGPEVLPDWGTVLATADAAKGQEVFAKCTSCHKVSDENGTGPGLNGIVGRAVAAHGGFAYSDAMKGHVSVDPKWTYDALFHFLKKPGGYVPGTKMTFVGLKSPEDRVNLIAYLHTINSSLPIPAPDPSRAAGAAAPAGAAGAAAPAEGAPGAAAAPTPTGAAPAAGAPGAPAAAPAPTQKTQ